MNLFDAHYAVFSHEVPEIYLQDYARLGGNVASNKADIQDATVFICNDQFDIDFIAIWYNDTYRVVTKRYIYDCMRLGHRPREKEYSWGVAADLAIVPTWSLLPWNGSIFDKRKATVVLEERSRKRLRAMEAESGPQLGLLTPAPSLVPHAKSKTKRNGK
ncbi:hypothetical protein C8F04DRAFT_1275665 [Mycena alexandri]|uniref:BRCT domain-containing protein n=1 Tax=Mycena alexandri TaxID=1745969 RepID=A0AAD6WP53_9AGAR|nr:hypothetical protein C8F04DRAFT_1275665 [Mycena alexandri]